MLAVDGDEIYDPLGLNQLRPRLLSGEFDAYWRIYGHVLHVTRLNRRRHWAEGYTSPPAHPMTKLYNLAAVDHWDHAPQRLHGGRLSLRPGWNLEKSVYVFHHHLDWRDSPFRCLHMVFLKRSSRQKWNAKWSPADRIQRETLGHTVWAKTKLYAYDIWIALRRKTGKDLAYRKGKKVRKEIGVFLNVPPMGTVAS